MLLNRKIKAYFAKHPVYNAFVHVLVGTGIGVLITYPFIQTHPLRWGILFLGVGLLGHLYPLTLKK